MWQQVFSGSLTWTSPTNSTAKIQAWGGGAAGSTKSSGSQGAYGGGYGGGGGDYAELTSYQLIQGNQYSIIVGNSVSDGTAAGSSSYFVTQSLLYAAAGTGGEGPLPPSSVGDIIFRGGIGGTGSFDKNNHNVAGGGGGSAFYNGNGQAGQSYQGTNTAVSGGLGQGIGGEGKVSLGGTGGSWPGGGGGGRNITTLNAPQAGGSGAGGAIVITWYEFTPPTGSYIPWFYPSGSSI